MKLLPLISFLFIVSILNAQVIKQISNDKTDLDFTNDKTLSTSLSHLIKKVKNKNIVAIGEDTHGTSEYYKLRFEITKKLIIEKGFNTIILENPYGNIEVLTKKLQTENIDKLMTNHLFSIYQTKEMKAFLLWFKEYTAIHKTIKLKGCDDSYGQMSQLLDNELLPNNNIQLNDLLKEFKARYLFSKEEYYKDEILPENTTDITYGAEAYSLLLKIEKTIQSEGLQTPVLEEYLFNLKNTFINYKNIAEGNIQSRDEIMADRISYYANKPNAKMIVWAHNAHISKTVIIDNEIGIMGQNLKEEFGDEYYAIGLSTNSGTYSYIETRFINNDRAYDDELLQDTFIFSKINSWEQLFSQVDSDAYYFEFNKYSRIRFRNARTKYLKLVGYNLESDKDYYLLSPQEMFDAIIFIKETNATIPLFGEAKPKRVQLGLVDLKAPANEKDKLPKGWYKACRFPNRYDIKWDSVNSYSGKKSISLQTKGKDSIVGFGNVSSSIKAEKYLGKTIKVSTYIKSENIVHYVGIWIRVDNENKKMLNYENTYNSAIKGNSDWTFHETIIKVPNRAEHIFFGVVLNGKGKYWFDDFKIEIISDNPDKKGVNTLLWDFEN